MVRTAAQLRGFGLRLQFAAEGSEFSGSVNRLQLRVLGSDTVYLQVAAQGSGFGFSLHVAAQGSGFRFS